jgi:MATE family multidrug resistance protein
MSAARPLSIQLLGLAWPVALARLGIMGMGVADTIMVGQLAPDELAHQALGWAPTGPFLVAGIGLLTGVQVLAARGIGAGQPSHAGAALRIGLWLALAAGLAATLAIWLSGPTLLMSFGVKPELAEPAAAVSKILALSIPLHLAYVACAYFLEAIQRPGAGAVVMWTANIVNIAANALLIPHFGAEGSAWATLASRAFLFLVLFGWIATRPFARDHGVFGRATPGAPGISAMLSVGVAASLSQAAEAGAFSAMTVIAGRIGDAEVAAYQIILNLLAVVFMIAMGIAAASAVLVSEAIGAGAPARARKAGWIGLALNTGFMLAAGLLLIAFAMPLARAFTADESLAALVAGLMWLAAIITLPDGGQVVAASALRARGDNWFPTASHILAYVVIMPPLAFWLAESQGQGVAGLLWAIFWASVVSVCVLIGRWWAQTRA